MHSMQRMTSASTLDGGKLDVDQQLGRMMSRTCAEAEKAAIATRDAARRPGIDRLTELPSVAALIDRFAQAAALADRHDGRLALLLVDFDGFAPFADATDRDAGDRLVVEVAQRLAGSVRAADTVCRLAGEQFVVLLTDVACDNDAASASRHVLFGLDGGAAAAAIGCSIGISFYPDHGHDVETLLGRADAALYCAKAMGPGHCRSYSEAAVVECSARLSVVSPDDQRHVRRASASATEMGLSDELRNINEELLRVSIRARDERDRAQQHLRIALAAADMGRWALDLKTGEVVRSVRHDQLFGYPALLPHWSLDIALARFVPEDRAAVSAAFADARTTGFVDFEHRIHRADDLNVRWLHVSGETVYQGGVASRIVGIVTDVTDRHMAEDELLQARKMQAVGRLTGSVAHDFNNLLMVIGGSVDLLAQRLVAKERTDLGTGLGLSQVHAFAKESGGYASIERNADCGAERGTIVTMHLPRRRPSRCGPEVGSGRHAIGTVLVVEDDPGVRATANAMLCDLGYAVIEADAADAVHAIVSANMPIDLILGDVVDVVFGDVVDEVVEMGRRRGGVPIVLTSARTGRCTIPDDLVDPMRVLRKPYTQADLAAILQDALGARGPADTSR